ncbi:MAG: hypothetical protein ABSG27_17095 [Candidatus Acidiferrales bacterium]|jgi:hypothetical protein
MAPNGHPPSPFLSRITSHQSRITSSLLVREYTPADLDALRRMHASQGFDYAFPDLADPIFISKLVVEDDDGRAVMASLARLTCEMYLLVDRGDSADAAPNRNASSRGPSSAEGPLFDVGSGDAVTQREIPRPPGRTRNDRSGRHSRVGNARQRYEWLLALHRAGEQDLLARGLDDAHAWLPPQIARRFGRRLESLGWVRDDAWTPYCRRLKSSG